MVDNLSGMVVDPTQAKSHLPMSAMFADMVNWREPPIPARLATIGDHSLLTAS